MTIDQTSHAPLHILVIDDEEHIRFAIAMCLEADGHQVESEGTIECAFEKTVRHAFDLIFLDVRLGTANGLDYLPRLVAENPWARIIVITAYASIETALQAMKLGATDYLPKPFEQAQLQLVTQKVAERRQLERTITALQKTLGSLDPEADFTTASPILRESLELARRVASTNVAVLIRGEPGTGKGRLARMIHQWSQRAVAPLSPLHFRGLDSTAAEAQLFGVAGDDTQPGAIAMTNGGTILLEEISDLPLSVQPRIVALLKDREFESPEAVTRRSCDVRVIATTHADLQAAAERGAFREDLFMAINIVPIDLPPLRERREDILPLAERYLIYFGREHKRTIGSFSADAAFVLRTHGWPGNLRELRNVIERAVLECQTDTIGLDHLPPNLLTGATAAAQPSIAQASSGYALGDLVPLDTIEEIHIRKVLATARTLRRAAAILGINASTLYRKLRRLRIDADDEKPPQ